MDYNLGDLPGEEWLPISGYETLYSVSTYGRVRSFPRITWNGVSNFTLPARIMRPINNGYGYPYVTLNIGKKNTKNFYLHRLVASAFLGSAPNARSEVNHKDGRKTNNCVCNLEWVSRRENAIHATDTGLRKSFAVERVDADGTTTKYLNAYRAASELGVSPYYIYGKIRTGAPCKNTRAVWRRVS